MSRTRWLSYLRVGLGVAGLCGALVLACAQCTTPPRLAPEVALYNDSTTALLRHYAECFLAKTAVTPRWVVDIEVVNDSAAPYYGRTLMYAEALEAHMRFNAYTIRRDHEDARIDALHETLHIVFGELTSAASNYNHEMSRVESERLVRQLTRWSVWDTWCTQ